MKIAVVGAGFAGMSVAWHLLHSSQASVALDIFDSLPIGEGTSGIASGLLHPYTGVRAKLAWKGERMMKEAHDLLTAASHYSERPSVLSKGILRLAKDEEQIEAFKLTAEQHRDCVWIEEKNALFITEGLTIDTRTYLKALMEAIHRLGGHWHEHSITDPSIFTNYDRVVIAMGASTTAFNVFAELPITKIKGQTLELAWPLGVDPLPMSLLSTCHIVMSRDQKSCYVGATFEREYESMETDISYAKKELLPAATKIVPALEDAKILGCRSGIRACPKTHKPLLGQLNERFWFYTGLCAKGLLYHGYLGKRLAEALLADNPALLPKEVYHHIEIPK